MGRKVPEPIRRKVLREWLEGIPRRQIATDNQIGTGTVSEIIKTIGEIDSEARIDILRETAIMLRREGLRIDDFAQIIHLRQFLNKIGLNDEMLEDFVRPLGSDDRHHHQRYLLSRHPRERTMKYGINLSMREI